MNEYTKSLYVLNKEQQKYSKKIEVTIECTDDTVHFIYNKLNFALDDENLNLHEYSAKITNQLLGKPMDADLMYYMTLLILSAELNYFDIGVVVNKQMKMWLEKKIDKLLMLNCYSDFCKVTDNRKVSVKEYEENIWNDNRFS